MKTTKKNRAFKRLTRADKAVAIAKDVIAQVRLAAYSVCPGTYADLDVSCDIGGDLQRFVKRKVTKRNPCAVCAIGSTFLSGVRLFDNFKVSRINSDEGGINPGSMRIKLANFFAADDLWMLEVCFELDARFVGLNDSSSIYNEWYNECHTLKNFLRKLDSEERLIWLMNVVITNKGTFTFAAAKRAALVTLGSSTEGRWLMFRALNIPRL